MFHSSHENEPRKWAERSDFRCFSHRAENRKEFVTVRAEASSTQVLEMKSPSLEQFSKAARSLRGDERVPYAFEKRIIAHLKNARPADIWNAWAPMMWRAALSCLLITAITAAVVEVADPSR